MKAAVFVLAAVFALGVASPAHAQLGGTLGKIKKAADRAVDAKQKYDDYNITPKEERQLGESVSLRLRQKFGVYQNASVTKYATLVGTTLAQASKSPELDWQFIVLDTDGVNAYAAPGGLVHITRGLLGLMKSEAELAGVLGHEVTHVTEQHTVDAIKQAKGITIAADAGGAGGSMRDKFIAEMAAKAFNSIFEGEFSQHDENEADQIGIRVANKVGYAPAGMVHVLEKIDARNGSRQDRNGMFASHPATKDRIDSLNKQIASEHLSATATSAVRYKQFITFDAQPVTALATGVEGAAGLATGDKKKPDNKAAGDGQKKGGLLKSITGGKQTQAQQQTASAGARGGVPDRDATGGPNKNALRVKVTAAEINAFKKGISA
ncbi:MAG: M48 family metalloprotease [Vicinamibacterales bacterium]